MSLPPITEDDKAPVEAMIRRIVRLRKRQAEAGGVVDELTDAIRALHHFGSLKGWWE